MTRIGIILAIVGALGFFVNFTGVYIMSRTAGDVRIWGGVAILGVVVAMLTRRPRD
jgi:uncharacterized membrane protein YdbT with pleckstrin-like domain